MRGYWWAIWTFVTSYIAGVVFGLSFAGYGRGGLYTLAMVLVLVVLAYNRAYHMAPGDTTGSTGMLTKILGGLVGFVCVIIASETFWPGLASPYDIPWQVKIDNTAPYAWALLGGLLFALCKVWSPEKPGREVRH